MCAMWHAHLTHAELRESPADARDVRATCGESAGKAAVGEREREMSELLVSCCVCVRVGGGTEDSSSEARESPFLSLSHSLEGRRTAALE